MQSLTNSLIRVFQSRKIVLATKDQIEKKKDFFEILHRNMLFFKAE